MESNGRAITDESGVIYDNTILAVQVSDSKPQDTEEYLLKRNVKQAESKMQYDTDYLQETVQHKIKADAEQEEYKTIHHDDNILGHITTTDVDITQKENAQKSYTMQSNTPTTEKYAQMDKEIESEADVHKSVEEQSLYNGQVIKESIQGEKESSEHTEGYKETIKEPIPDHVKISSKEYENDKFNDIFVDGNSTKQIIYQPSSTTEITDSDTTISQSNYNFDSKQDVQVEDTPENYRENQQNYEEETFEEDILTTQQSQVVHQTPNAILSVKDEHQEEINKFDQNKQKQSTVYSEDKDGSTTLIKKKDDEYLKDDTKTHVNTVTVEAKENTDPESQLKVTLRTASLDEKHYEQTDAHETTTEKEKPNEEYTAKDTENSEIIYDFRSG